MRRLFVFFGLLLAALLAVLVHQSVALQGPPWLHPPKLQLSTDAARSAPQAPIAAPALRGPARGAARMQPPIAVPPPDTLGPPQPAPVPDSTDVTATPEQSIAVTVQVVPQVRQYKFALLQNIPNPGPGPTNIRYSIARGCQFSIVVYSVMGQRVATLVDGYHQPGQYSVHWNARDDYGRPVPFGVYIYRAHGGGYTASRKMIIR